MTITRRRFLASTLGAPALAGPFAALAVRPATARTAVSPDYGPLAPVRDHTTGLPLLSLPKGLEYLSFGWTRDPMSDGLLTPSNHDGMAAFRLDDTIHLVRNHERREGVGAAVQGAARIVRGEGCWFGNGLVYFISTSGGAASEGQVFALDPVAQTLTCVFASPGPDVLDNPDNIAVSPRGGIILCEDGDNPVQSLHGLTPNGEIFRFAENHVVLAGERNNLVGSFSDSEWAGATFEPKNGNWLFVNIQSPGITFAITGPWQAGAL